MSTAERVGEQQAQPIEPERDVDEAPAAESPVGGDSGPSPQPSSPYVESAWQDSSAVHPAPDMERIVARLRLAEGLEWDCGMSITPTCIFELSLNYWGKAPASKRCVDWREATRQRPHAPAGLVTAVNMRLPRGMDESAADRAIEYMSPYIVACYEEGLAVRSPFEARLAVRLTIDARGCITRAAPVHSTFPTARMRRCTVNLFLAKALPPPAVAPATVTLTLAFTPDPSRELVWPEWY